jgi:hypothetical protein
VAAAGIVEPIDILEDRVFCLTTCVPAIAQISSALRDLKIVSIMFLVIVLSFVTSLVHTNLRLSKKPGGRLLHHELGHYRVLFLDVFMRA